jgi:AhpD family alkylhydroperoxidase
MSDLTTQPSLAADPRVIELVALGAAVGSNCEACFRSHYQTARGLGLSDSELVQAVGVAHAVKETPARRMLDLAARKLGVPVAAFTAAGATAAGETADVSPEPSLDESATCC